MTPGALLLQACFTQRRLVIHLFLMGLAPSKCTKWSETKDTESLSLKSVQGAFLSLISRYPPKRRHGVKIHQRECQFAQIPFFQGLREKQDLTQEFRIPQVVPLFDLQKQYYLTHVLLARGRNSSVQFSNMHYKIYKNMLLV